jgi:homopolymeric O-antigen transport system ATP-binding protein
MSQPIIEVENLSKRYQLGQFNARSLREEIERLLHPVIKAGNGKAVDRDFWALRDVSFTVAPGEVVGIIGRNGAGKSTLLKILSRVTEPTTGVARIRGRVASLLEVGTGFHPELTGRDNIYLNGAILGMTRARIKAKFDEIVDFSGVQRFLDTPVKRYSSGMHVRLAFAVAAHLEPEILIVDEVLAVGDVEFQKKCLGKIQEVSERAGRTVLFVSHNLTAIQALCDYAFILHEGRIHSAGLTTNMIGEYRKLVAGADNQDRASLKQIARPAGLQTIIVDGMINGTRMKGIHSILPESSVEFVIKISLPESMSGCTVGIQFVTEFGVVIYSINTRWALKGIRLDRGSHEISASLKRFPLVSGRYSISLGFSSDRRQVDRIDHAGEIDVIETDVFGTGELPWPGQGYLITHPVWNVRRLGVDHLQPEPHA